MADTFTYLDYAASAPVSQVALDAEAAYERQDFAGANPNSLHTLGRRAARALDGARRDLVSCLGGRFRPTEVTFTSGGTEANNLALIGLAEGAREAARKRNRVLISAIEHDSVLDAVSPLRQRGFEVELIAPDAQGIVRPDTLKNLLDDSVALVSVMSANNETGIVQPVGELARLAHASGALMHTDAVQAFGRIPLQLDDVDAVSVAAHKIGGPVGVGALVCRQKARLRAQSFGGGQEMGRRAGTQDVCGALAFAAAARDCCDHLDERRAAVSARARELYDLLGPAGIKPTVPLDAIGFDGRLPGLVSILVPGVDSETLVLECDQAGFEVSAASACSSGSLDASHVLLAMGIPRDEALCSLRISFDERVEGDTLAAFAGVLAEIVARRGQGGRRG